jgi:hypothetical protein
LFSECLSQLRGRLIDIVLCDHPVAGVSREKVVGREERMYFHAGIDRAIEFGRRKDEVWLVSARTAYEQSSKEGTLQHLMQCIVRGHICSLTLLSKSAITVGGN